MSKLLLNQNDYKKYSGRDFNEDFRSLRKAIIAISGPLREQTVDAETQKQIDRLLSYRPYCKNFVKQLIDKEIRGVIFERDNFTCLICGATDNLSVDHVLAESKGGATTLDNLQTLCRSCNSRKGAR